MLLRAEIQRLKESLGITQGGVGDLLGITQQTASKILSGDSGIGYQTATKLAEALGYDGVDSLLDDLGLGKAEAHADVFPERQLAARIARVLGASNTAIARVRDRCTGDAYAERRARWWVEEFLHETDAEQVGKSSPPGGSPRGEGGHKSSGKMRAGKRVG